MIIGGLVSVGLFVPGVIKLYTENLWFSELGYDSVFWKIMKTHWGLFAKFTAVAAVFLGINYLVIDRICPVSSEFRRWTKSKTNFVRKLCVIIIILISLVIAAPTMIFWEDFIKYENSVPVGKNQIGILNAEKKEVQPITPNLDKQLGTLVFDSNDNLYAIEENSIAAVDMDTGVLTPIIKDIEQPQDVIFDENGDMYVAAGNSVYIARIENGTWSKKIVVDDLSHPSAIALDSKGYLYVADFEENEIIGFNDGDLKDDGEREIIIEHSKSRREERAKKIVESRLIIDDKLRKKLGALYSTNGIDLLSKGQYEDLINELEKNDVTLSLDEEKLLPRIASVIKKVKPLELKQNKARKSVLSKLSQGNYKEAINMLSIYLVSLSKEEKTLLKSSSEELSGPIELVYSEEDNLLYVAEWKSGEVSQIDLFLRSINRVAKGLSNPRSLAIDSQNELYIAEASSGEISSITQVTEEQSATPRLSGVIRGLSSPTSLVLDSKDNLYIAEALDRDPIFNKKIGFFMFKLPVYNIVTIWTKVLLWTTIIFCAFVYHFYLSYNRDPQSMTRVKLLGVKHISFLFLMLFGISIIRSKLNIYNLLTSPLMALHYGIGYTDIMTRIPGYKIFMAIVAGLGVVIIINMFKRKKFLWYISGLVWSISYPILIWAIPFLFYQFRVKPNELRLAPPYIRKHIDSTRKGFGLDKIKEQETQLSQATMDTIRQNADVLRNIQLWDRQALYDSVMQLQIIRHYYAFHPFTDVDRYNVTMGDGTKQYRELLLAAREITTEEIEPANWINKHLSYTHGYGVCAAPVNEFSPEGRPVFWVEDIPIVSQFPSGAPIKELNVTQPRIYYGEMTDTYVIVGTNIEFDYTKGEENSQKAEYQYEGHGGIEMGGLFRRLAFSWRFKRLKIMLSESIHTDSRMMFRREILKRVKACAPFLEFDEDPFIVIGDSGKLWWIIDTYVTDDDYPYSQPFPVVGKRDLKRYAPRDPGIQDFHGANYIRNPAVAIVNAYNGDVNVYILNENEPLIQTYAKAFPGVFKSQPEIPDGLEKHIRYPDTYVYLKAQMYAKYHQDDPETFYKSEDLWKLPKEMYNLEWIPMTPYFATYPLPGKEPKAEFVSMFPFIPPGTTKKMAAWLVGRSDVPHYGETLVYKLPPNERPDSPEMVEGRIEKIPDYAATIEILGEKVVRGNLLVIPIGEDIVYVEPIYYQEHQTKADSSVRPMPEARYVFVAASDRLAIATTMDEAIKEVFVGEMVETTGMEEKKMGKENWSQWKQVLRGNKPNTTNIGTPVTPQTTFGEIADAGVSDNDTVNLEGTDHFGERVWGIIPINPNKTINDFLDDIQRVRVIG